jgi:hypothetical protein
VRWKTASAARASTNAIRWYEIEWDSITQDRSTGNPVAATRAGTFVEFVSLHAEEFGSRRS